MAQLPGNVTNMHLVELEASPQPPTAPIPAGILPEPTAHPLATVLLPEAQPCKEIEDLIIGLEHETIKAHTLRDNSTYNTYLTPNSKAVSPQGVVCDAVSVIWQRWGKRYTMSEERVLKVADNVAIIYYKLEMRLCDKPGWPFNQLRSSTWMKVEDKEEWRRVFHQCTERSK
jgi:hypothetical protein